MDAGKIVELPKHRAVRTAFEAVLPKTRIGMTGDDEHGPPRQIRNNPKHPARRLRIQWSYTLAPGRKGNPK
jgi:hypothetical protein